MGRSAAGRDEEEYLMSGWTCDWMDAGSGWGLGAFLSREHTQGASPWAALCASCQPWHPSQTISGALSLASSAASGLIHLPVQLPVLSAGSGLLSPEAQRDEFVCTAWAFNLLGDL